MTSRPRHAQRGRKPGSNDYGESTRAIRIPLSLYPELQQRLACMKKMHTQKAWPANVLLPAGNAKNMHLPLFAHRVPAGFPSPADDYIERTLDLNEHLIDHPSATFFVRVTGCSMEGAGIHDGDLLVVDRALEPVHGRIVIAAIDGELTVKRLRIGQEGIWLEPENPAYSALQIVEGLDCVIWGVVRHVIHAL